jgi:cell division protein FtsB
MMGSLKDSAEGGWARLSAWAASHSRKFWWMVGGSALLLWVVLGGQRGFLKLVSLQREKWGLQSEIRALDQDNLRLAAEARDLQSHPGDYERKAREELMLAKPGEIIYRFDKNGQP